MTKSGFDVLKYPADVAHPTNVAFKRLASPDAQPTEEETTFARQVERAVRRVNELMRASVSDFPANPRYQNYLALFFYAAKNGVQHKTGNLVQGAAALESAKEYFVIEEGPKLRRHYLERLHAATFILLLIAVVGLVLLEYKIKAVTLLDQDWRANLQALAVAGLGIGLGTWLRRLLDHETLTWENLAEYGSSLYTPAVRYLMMIALAVVLMILLGTGIVEVKIADYALAAFTTDPKAAIVIGLAFGLAEKRMTKTVLGAFAE